MTDFENAALVTFIVLLTRAIITYNLNLLIPITNVRDTKEVNYNTMTFINIHRLMKICNWHNNVTHF